MQLVGGQGHPSQNMLLWLKSPSCPQFDLLFLSCCNTGSLRGHIIIKFLYVCLISHCNVLVKFLSLVSYGDGQ